MGFFDFLGDIVSSVVDGVVDAIDNVVNFFCGSVGSESSYKKEEADIYTTERLNEILISFTNDYLPQADDIEKTIIKDIVRYYDDLIAEVKKINKDSKQISLRRLVSAKRNIRNTIEGSIRTPLEKRMSLSDNECLTILKMKQGQDKQKAMKEFVNKVLNEALNNLVRNVKRTLHDQTDEVKEQLDGILSSRQKELSVLKEQYETLLNAKEKEEDKERICLKPALTITASKMVQNVFVLERVMKYE